MSHDIQDLLNLIKALEKRVITLERTKATPVITVDAWYWDY